MPRRLAAILAADVVGYSALMEQDEAGTLASLIAFRRKVFDPQIERHGGRVVKLMGDGTLVEFASVVDAVACAVDIQKAVAGQTPDGLHLRIGVNLGDVIDRDGDIYGTGVNIAARLEAMAEAGGICVSDIVRHSVGNRIEAGFVDAGEHRLKNIETPVRVYRWVPEGRLERILNARARNRPDRPSIAVLAFDNMSADPEQEYFSDGIAEDIITALSHFREFFVIARNSSFTYKGQSTKVDQVCRDLGVRYLVEGSVRKAGNRARITAQLIDGETGAHIWASRFDRDLDDIFAVQDEITQAIVSAVAPETLGAELKRARAKRAENLNAWDKVLQARWYMGRLRKSDYAKARQLLTEAVSEDPTLSDALATLALCEMHEMLHQWQPDARAAIEMAATNASEAVHLDQNNANALAVLGMAQTFVRKYEDASDHLEQAIRLNPNLASAYGVRSAWFGVSGQYEDCRASAKHALALSPRDPTRFFWLGGFGIGAYLAGEYEDCIEVSRQVLKDFPGYASAMRQECASLAMLGRKAEATASLQRILERWPDQTVSQVRNMVPVRYPDDHERWLDGLRIAGLPE